MRQTFNSVTSPQDGPPRLAKLRECLAYENLSGFFVPRADAHQGENVAPRDERLAWLTGFTGSAGFCIATTDNAGVFVDGRYRLQVRGQVDLEHFAPVPWPETQAGDWLIEALPDGGAVGYDPWLHTKSEIDAIKEKLERTKVTLTPVGNLVDRIWIDQPDPPSAPGYPHPIEFSGETSEAKRKKLGKILKNDRQSAAILTLPDSIAWLLNIRGSDVARTPVLHGFAILHLDGSVDLFADKSKFSDELRAYMGDDVRIAATKIFGAALDFLAGPVRVDKKTAPEWVSRHLKDANVDVSWGTDPCILAKAVKNSTEIDGSRQAHLQDGIAMAEFLAWLDGADIAAGLTEIDLVTKLERFRVANDRLRDISFETICGSGPNGAIVHYRVTDQTNRQIAPGELVLIDSGGQYETGTTDITRTVSVGEPDAEEIAAFTAVLKGMLAIAMARWPAGLAGRDLDALARNALWQSGRDYDHGTGHGVGSYLGVHEGPQALSRKSTVALEPGMILSNEPGYYREGAFGVRIENLVAVQKAPTLKGGDDRDMLCFETLSYTPIDRRLIDKGVLTPAEINWINTYHADIIVKISPNCSPAAQAWLAGACAPI